MTAFLIENIAPLMFVALVVILLLGYPVAFGLAAVGIAFLRGLIPDPSEKVQEKTAEEQLAEEILRARGERAVAEDALRAAETPK